VTGTVALTERWPVLGRHERAGQWLQVWSDLGRAEVPQIADLLVHETWLW
jgi:hypothetical protein